MNPKSFRTSWVIYCPFWVQYIWEENKLIRIWIILQCIWSVWFLKGDNIGNGENKNKIEK